MIDSLDVLWSDARVDAIECRYDEVRVRITETTGRRVEVVATGQIGLAVEGIWDETVVDQATIVATHPFAERCVQSVHERLGSPPPPSGSTSRNRGQFETLVVLLVDGSTILCAAGAFKATAI